MVSVSVPKKSYLYISYDEGKTFTSQPLSFTPHVVSCSPVSYKVLVAQDQDTKKVCGISYSLLKVTEPQRIWIRRVNFQRNWGIVLAVYSLSLHLGSTESHKTKEIIFPIGTHTLCSCLAPFSLCKPYTTHNCSTHSKN